MILQRISKNMQLLSHRKQGQFRITANNTDPIKWIEHVIKIIRLVHYINQPVTS